MLARNCFYKGRRFVELIAGSLAQLLHNLRHCSSAKLRDYLQQASEKERIACMAFMEPILEKLVNEIQVKTAYLFSIPYIFLGALSHVFGRWSIDHSRSLVRQGLVELKVVLDRGDMSKLTTVKMHLVIGDKNAYALQLHTFAEDGPLRLTALG